MAARKLAILAVSIGVAGGAATACADHPNRDLNEYTAPAPTTAPRTAAHTADTHAATARPSASPAARGSALLTVADVHGEGVTKAPAEGGALPGCLAEGRAGGGPAPAAAWRYPTGSMLYQYLLRPPAAAARHCGTPLPGVAEQGRAWCTDAGCGAAVSAHGTVSVLRVASDRREKAAEAVRRLAPALAARVNAG